MAHQEQLHGLAHDLRTLAALEGRRRMLRLIASAGLLPLIGCRGSDGRSAAGAGRGGSTAGSSADGGATDGCTELPEETAGPFPGDGTNGPSVLSLDGVVRSDIRSSFGSLSGTAQGVPLTVNLSVIHLADSCARLVGAAVYLWHCDRDRNYSLYNVPEQNYLRGVQETNAQGVASFTTIFPGCYSGRWPHIHFEVFASLASAMTGRQSIKTSQLAFPKDVCDAAYTASGYATSVANLSRITLASDNVFRDGSDTQLATVTGDSSAGYVASLSLGVAL